MVKQAVVVEQEAVTMEDLYSLMAEIKEYQMEIIEKLENVSLPGSGFRVFDVDEQ